MRATYRMSMNILMALGTRATREDKVKCMLKEKVLMHMKRGNTIFYMKREFLKAIERARDVNF